MLEHLFSFYCVILSKVKIFLNCFETALKRLWNKKRKQTKEKGKKPSPSPSLARRPGPSLPSASAQPSASLPFLFPSLGLVAQQSKQAGPNPGLIGRTSLSLCFLSSLADTVTPPVNHLPFLLPWAWASRTPVQAKNRRPDPVFSGIFPS